ncbi:MAG: PmoA family protein [Saprospiraceae bacterium]|nr:PmoA family protein [Saprospiraceae bacterium]
MSKPRLSTSRLYSSSLWHRWPGAHRGLPEDHPHHRGVFWTWHQVIIGDKHVGDAWACDNISWDVQSITHDLTSDGSLRLKAQTDWESPLWLNKQGNQEPFLRENTTVSIYLKKKNYRVIDFEISLLALTPQVKIGGSDDEKGYSGFSVRMKLPEDITFQSNNGAVTPTTNAVEAGPWMQMEGSLTRDDQKSGIVIISHSENPTYPEPWILRNKNSMQNAAYPGRYPAEISDKAPTILRYRMVVYQGEMKEKNISRLQKSY